MIATLAHGRLGKRFFSVTRRNFSYALDSMRREIGHVTDQKIGLSVSFFKASRNKHECPEMDVPALLGEVSNPTRIPRRLWREANLVEAVFTAAAGDKSPAIKAVLYAKHTRLNITFDIEPSREGCKIGDHLLNDDPRFKFWTKGMQSVL